MADALKWTRADFPADFVFGVATSAYQIEGQAYGNAGKNHWDSFAATPGNVIKGENGAIACDHYHRYPEDLALVNNAGLDAYRFSAAWSRVIPDGIGQPNPEGLDFYDRLVDEICAQHLKPCLTLYHWELPSPLADLGGWCNAEIVNWFAEYSDTILSRIGDRLYATAPINEPWCVGWLSHFMGLHAPGLRDIRAAARAMHHVLLAQAHALDVIRSHNAGRPGVVFNFEYPLPVDSTAEATAAAECYDAIYNRWFLEATCNGVYPGEALRYLEPWLPSGWESDLDKIAVPVDWYGVNYYTRKLLGPSPDGPLPAVAEHVGDLPQTSMGWEIFPSGIRGFLERVHTASKGRAPIFVTENGLASNDTIVDGIINDTARIDYLNAHLAEVRTAIDHGVPVAGYFIWSLLDNYEWALGYDKRFGLVHVDFETLKRTPKASWFALRDALKS